ncbi:winged helix-turn-helix transcriptional regulator [Streptomyces ferralitis]|uniref:Winged helix-turn-helix transcriptional regulator n=2 Tax=Streptantibioticus ferralitis TaxID=236510 RepID=A0ABT5YYF3_9ACTN|nr:winged helix-turn-helix transcriptional regulator [Streptantibioticus ferralitis]MDF2256627.1 winged helix-turn-helix transcriptional regulator [Streptantibioticus ferralitis]
MPRRSYDQYCAIARALDTVGDRWTLLIVRELLAGPRRYTDLHADLPGVSTDVLASRLRDMERDGLTTRRRLPPPATAVVYELTPHGRDLLPVLVALAGWGSPALSERRATDAMRAHWFAIPLMSRLKHLAFQAGTIEIQLEEGVFHLRFDDGELTYGDGPAQLADARLILGTETCVAIADDSLSLEAGLKQGRIQLRGEGPLASALRQT